MDNVFKEGRKGENRQESVIQSKRPAPSIPSSRGLFMLMQMWLELDLEPQEALVIYPGWFDTVRIALVEVMAAETSVVSPELLPFRKK